MWLYLPAGWSESSASAPVEADSTSGSDSLFQSLARSASWKTKSLPERSWRRVWKRETYLPRLFGLTYEPSTASRGVEQWISLWAGIPVSPLATLASASAPTTPATSGLTSPALLPRVSQISASSRTSALICRSDSTRSPETFKAWATELRRHCLQRRKSALLTAANGSSSWPTAQAHDAVGGKTPEQVAAMRLRTGAGVSNLNEAAAMWPTARASYNENRTTKDAPSHGVTHGATLAGTAGNWQTPNAAAEAPNLGSNIKNGPKPLLAQAVGLRGQETSTDGDTSSPSGPTSRRRLNPKFVTALMGWPEGWTSLAPTNSTSSATESSPLKQQQPS